MKLKRPLLEATALTPPFLDYTQYWFFLSTVVGAEKRTSPFQSSLSLAPPSEGVLAASACPRGVTLHVGTAVLTSVPGALPPVPPAYGGGGRQSKSGPAAAATTVGAGSLLLLDGDVGGGAGGAGSSSGKASRG